MIPSSAVLPVAFGEQPPVLRSGQWQGADQEPPSEQRSEGQPGYLVGSRLHLHRHPAPITATPPTDIPPTVIQAMDTQPIHDPAMDTQVIRVLPVIPVPRLMDTRADLRRRVTLLLLAMDTPAIRNIPLSPVHQPMGTKATQDTPATPVLRAMVSRAAWNSRATSVLPAMNREPTWSTHPTQVPLALNMGWNRVKPRCRRLRAMNTRARRRIPVTPFPVIDLRQASSLTRLADG